MTDRTVTNKKQTDESEKQQQQGKKTNKQTKTAPIPAMLPYQGL